MNYLLTGATGGLAQHVLEQVTDVVPNASIHLLVHNAAKAEAFKAAGYTVHVGDYLDYDTLTDAFTGIDRLLFISSSVIENRQTQHQNVVRAAKEAGVPYIAYTSFANAAEAAKSNQLAKDHAFTEQAISQSGIAHTFLRNNWYLENELPVINAAIASGNFIYTADKGKTGWALKREYAEAAAKVLVNPTSYKDVLELSGRPLTYAQLGQALKEATAKDLALVHGTDEAFMAQFTDNGLPQSVAALFLSFQQAIDSDVLNQTNSDFETVLGKELTPLAQAIQELLAAQG